MNRTARTYGAWRLVGAALCLAALAEARPIERRHGQIGVGLALGQPSVVSGKLWLTSRHAVDAGLGWDFVLGEFRLHSDYLWHWFDTAKLEKGKGHLAFYAGFGGTFSLGGGAEVGVRVPVGMAYHFEHDPIELFVEAAPGIKLSPSTRGLIQGGIGARYFF